MPREGASLRRAAGKRRGGGEGLAVGSPSGENRRIVIGVERVGDATGEALAANDPPPQSSEPGAGGGPGAEHVGIAGQSRYSSAGADFIDDRLQGVAIGRRGKPVRLGEPVEQSRAIGSMQHRALDARRVQRQVSALDFREDRPRFRPGFLAYAWMPQQVYAEAARFLEPAGRAPLQNRHRASAATAGLQPKHIEGFRAPHSSGSFFKDAPH